MCRLSSQSVNKEISISKVDIELNPEFKDFITCKVNENGLNEIRLAPGETYEVVFPFRIKKSYL